MPEILLVIRCSLCGNELHIDTYGGEGYREHRMKISVRPCQRCSQRQYKVGKLDGIDMKPHEIKMLRDKLYEEEQ